jgi:hypothetical protein
MNNVALYKPVAATPMYQGDGGGHGWVLRRPLHVLFIFVLPTLWLKPYYVTDGIINQDNQSASMAHTLCDGSGWIQVDLGSSYNLSYFTIWNRWDRTQTSPIGGSNAPRLNGATVTLFNTWNDTMGVQTLTGDATQT